MNQNVEVIYPVINLPDVNITLSYFKLLVNEIELLYAI